jgi:hypothetical protein
MLLFLGTVVFVGLPIHFYKLRITWTKIGQILT